MADDVKIEELEKKVEELRSLKDNCTLTNDIKIALGKYIQQNKANQDILIEEIAKIVKPAKFNLVLIISIILNILLLVSIGNHFYLNYYEKKIKEEGLQTIHKQQEDKNAAK
ncbi:hypothetical protein [Sulfurimonas sp. HSL3-2]|uniref:hypothetical protein n=1 Tax=Hydrocurvibacter mobilis TaxID=3131936 RepID=UPI0031F92AFB